MGATKRMITNNPELLGDCHRPALHWMEQEYYQSLKEKNNESIRQIEVNFEIVSGQESSEESTPEVGGAGHNDPEVFNNQPID